MFEVGNNRAARLLSASIMASREDPAQEAWELLWRIVQAHRPRFLALAQELGLSPAQLHALRLMEPGAEVPMSSLAGRLFCDASNVTGIVDRLESRGLIERRPAAHDRRVKLLSLTEEGARVREIAWRQMSRPPAEIAALPLEHRRALRDALRAAFDQVADAGDTEAPAPTARG
jgi:MarR family transcriptional regulator, organic hydroperoxide resistance regulator